VIDLGERELFLIHKMETLSPPLVTAEPMGDTGT
jgi:hypothetical protein